MQNYDLYFEQMDDFHTASYSYIKLKLLSDSDSRLETLIERCGIPSERTDLVKTMLNFIIMELSAEEKGKRHYVDVKSLLCHLFPQIDINGGGMSADGERKIRSMVEEHYGTNFRVNYADTAITRLEETYLRIYETNRVLHYVDTVDNVVVPSITFTLIAPSAAPGGFQALAIVASGMYDESAGKITISLNADLDDEMLYTLRYATMLESLSTVGEQSKLLEGEKSSTSFLIEGGSLQNDIIIIHIFLNENGKGAVEQLRYILNKMLDYEEALLSSIKRAQSGESTVVTVMEGFGLRFPTNLISNMTRTVTQANRVIPSIAIVTGHVEAALKAYVEYNTGKGEVPAMEKQALWFLGEGEQFGDNLNKYCELLFRIAAAEVDVRAMHAIGSPNDENIDQLDDAIELVSDLVNEIELDRLGSIKVHNTVEGMSFEAALKSGEMDIPEAMDGVTGSLEWIMLVSSDRFGEFV
jgi:hypothetical protein